jgi:hypothetical protein
VERTTKGALLPLVIQVGLSIGGCGLSASSVPPSSATAPTAPLRSSSEAVAQQLPISPEPSAQPSREIILVPSSCVVENGRATATGTFTFSRDERITFYQTWGAVVELRVYGSRKEGAQEHSRGEQLAQLDDEHRFTVVWNKPWSVAAPLETPEAAASCEVGVRFPYPYNPEKPSPPTTLARPHQLPISVDPQHQNHAAILHPESCILDNGVVTAKGTFVGKRRDDYLRVGAVVDLRVYSAPSSPPPGTFKTLYSAMPITMLPNVFEQQVARLAEEHTFAVAPRGPWTVTVPVDPQGEPAARCEVEVLPVQQTAPPPSPPSQHGKPPGESGRFRLASPP